MGFHLNVSISKAWGKVCLCNILDLGGRQGNFNTSDGTMNLDAIAQVCRDVRLFLIFWRDRKQQGCGDIVIGKTGK